MAKTDEYDHLHLVFHFNLTLTVLLDNLVTISALERRSCNFHNYQNLNCVPLALVLKRHHINAKILTP